MTVPNLYTPLRSRPEIIYYVTSESDCYGPECTTEQARVIAEYIFDKMAAYAEQQGYQAEILIVTHRGPDANDGEYEDDPEAAALNDMSLYEEAHWADWAAEALADE